MHPTTIGLDLAKHVFQIHGVDGTGHVVIRKKLRRSELVDFFTRLPPCLVGMEASGDRALLGTRIVCTRARSASDAGGLCQTLRQARQER